MNTSLIVFNSGLQTKTADHLLTDSESVECVNVNLDKGSIFPYRDWYEEVDSTATGIYPYFFNNSLITNSAATDDRHYVVFGSRLYWTNGSYSAYGIIRWNGSAGVNATPPTVTTYGDIIATATAGGELDATYSYVYTVVDTDGIESLPSPPQTVTPVGQAVSLNIGSVTTEVVVETVASRRIYRTGGANPTYNLVVELPAGTTTYTDVTRDIDISRTELTSLENYTPETNLTNLVLCMGTMFASVDNKIYFSKNGQPEFWNPLDYVVLEDTCTGLGVFRDTVVAFTEFSAYVIRGYDAETLEMEKLPYNEGCLNSRTITSVSDNLMWTSKNGICLFDGNSVSVITRKFMSWFEYATIGDLTFDEMDTTFDGDTGYVIEAAKGLRGKYYAVHQSGMLIVDISGQFPVSYNVSMATRGKGIYFDTYDGKLAVIDEAFDIWKFDSSANNLQAVWKTGKIAQHGVETLKQFRKVRLSAKPDYVRVWVDDSEVLYIENTQEFYLPHGCIGDTIQFEIGTSVEIKTLRYEYGVPHGRKSTKIQSATRVAEEYY